ncbi:NAD(P)H-dependent oxidoreductase [bacterium]|nr:NAD(P)H-dependent oxidoreductase [bacterium]
MKITVLNGSPKGRQSVTLQYVHYIQKEFPQHELKIFHVSQRMKKIETDDSVFQEILDSLRTSNGILWSSPVYYFLIPSNFKKFIELIFEKGKDNAFLDKHTAFLSSSIHFFDHTAHNYMRGICEDLGMRYVGSYSAEIHDLLKEKERERLRLFGAHFFDEIEKNTPTPKSSQPLTWRDFEYIPSEAKKKVDTGSKKILMITDSQNHQRNLVRMIERLRSSFSTEIEVANLHDLDIKGPCQGCLNCAYENQCVYQGKDDFNEFYNTQVRTADILIWAGKITDRYLSSRWKQFFDRSFFVGHAPSLRGKQIGFLISGPLSQIPNLRQILEAYVEMQHANLAGIVTDETGDSAEIDHLLETMAGCLIRFSEDHYIQPYSFLRVGGEKLFRDQIWGHLRFPFRADHEVYKKLGLYDFPQKDYRSRIQNSIMLSLYKIPRIRKKINTRLKKEMVKPLQKVLED